MVDVQNERPDHEIPIDKVGINGLFYPIHVLDRNEEYQPTIGNFEMSVCLPKSYRGTHMSRFVAILNRHRGEITYRQIEPILREIKRDFDAKQAYIRIDFQYFISKSAPVSGEKALLPINAFFIAELGKSAKKMDANSSESSTTDRFSFQLGVVTPVTTLCPCSREISKYGAHNQRAAVTIIVEFDGFVWIEELVEIAEAAASAPVFTLLKRPDEKYITEMAYENPRFVEDLVRNVAVTLDKDDRISYYKVEVESEESIHTHNAIAMIERNKNLQDSR